MKHNIKHKMMKKIVSVLLVLSIFAGIFPMTVSADGGTVGESLQNPILISEMDQLIEEMEKNVDAPTYYKLTEDISHETSIKYLDGREDETGDDGFTTIRQYSNSKLVMAQCVVGTGKKFLELDGYDIHYKNNVNFDNDNNSKKLLSGPKFDSLTFFYLGEGCDLTVSNTNGDDAEVWYDGWMHNRTNFFDGPNYTYTAVRDVFRVDTGAELTVSNTDIKAGRNRKIWMVHSYYLDKDKETNLLAKITYNGYAYEQIYGSAIVANGGKVTINGGYIEGRGGYRNQFNVSGVPSYDRDNIECMFADYTKESMIKNCLSNVGGKAAVQISGEGSTVIINDGEFWGCGGANAVGINGYNGGSVKEYTLRINAGTFDTSKTDKERVPDRNAGTPNSGPWPWSNSNFMLWGNCRCIRDTLRGNIGIPAVDGYGEKVFNMRMVHVYIDDEDNEVTYNSNNDNAYYEDLDFRYKSDSDTIIVTPREETDYQYSFTHTKLNYANRKHYNIYAYSGGEIIASTEAGFTLYHGPAESPALYFSAESHYDLTDEDNPYFDRAHRAVCKWVLYEEDKNGNLINAYERVSAPFHTEQKEGHTVYNFKIPLNYFTRYSAVKWDRNNKYYMVAYMEERFDTAIRSYVTKSYTSDVFRDVKDGVYDGVFDYYYDYGLEIVYDEDYCGSFATSGAEVVYSNAVYDSEPVLTFNDAFSKLKGSKIYQWQVLEGEEWVDYGNTRISPELAVEVLLMHRGLTGKQVRMKITSYDGIYKDALYSNACTVQKDQNTLWPDINVFNWEEDPNNTGRYITKTNVYNDWLEWLIYPYNSSRDLSALDWSKAKDVPLFDNLEVGVYTVYARFRGTEDFEAGTEIGYSKVVVGPYTAPTGTNILYNGKPVNEIFVKQNETFQLTVGPVPDNATLNSTNVTTWLPDTKKSNMLHYEIGNGICAAFDKSVIGRTITFLAVELGYVTINAQTTLADGEISTEPITVRVVPDNFIPYTVSVVNRGAGVYEGGSFVPQLSLHARVEMLAKRRATKFEAEDLLESDIKTQLQSDTIKKQLRDRLTWALVVPIPQLGMPPYTESTNKASINTKTGEITLKGTAVAGNVIRFVGILNDPYLGQIIIPGSFTVVDAPALEVHTHSYEGFSTEDNSDTHYRVCECGEKITENHSFTEYTVERATETSNMVRGYVCTCGYSYKETMDGTIITHVHALEYDYDNNEHWQICTDENCPDEYETTRQTHSFQRLTDENGNEAYVCTVCKSFATDTLGTLSGKVTSFNSDTDDIVIELFAGDSEVPDYTVTVKGNKAEYSITGVAEGVYTMRISKANHVTCQYTVVINAENVVQNAETWLFGDVTGEGCVDATDYLRIKGDFLGTYELEGISTLAGDVNKDGVIDSTDYLRIKGHFLGTYNLFS